MSGINIFQASLSPQTSIPAPGAAAFPPDQGKTRLGCGCQISATASPYNCQSKHTLELSTDWVWKSVGFDKARGSTLKPSPLPPRYPSLSSHFLSVTLQGPNSPQGWSSTPITLKDNLSCVMASLAPHSTELFSVSVFHILLCTHTEVLQHPQCVFCGSPSHIQI